MTDRQTEKQCDKDGNISNLIGGSNNNYCNNTQLPAIFQFYLG